MIVESLMLYGMLLAAATPPIVEAVKKFGLKNKLVLSLSPVILSFIVWVGDILLTGVNPFKVEQLLLFVGLFTASAGGAKFRDIWKYAKPIFKKWIG